MHNRRFEAHAYDIHANEPVTHIRSAFGPYLANWTAISRPSTTLPAKKITQRLVNICISKHNQQDIMQSKHTNRVEKRSQLPRQYATNVEI